MWLPSRPTSPVVYLVEPVPAAVPHRIEFLLREIHLILVPVDVFLPDHVDGTTPARHVAIPGRFNLADSAERARADVLGGRAEAGIAPALRADLDDLFAALDGVEGGNGILEPRAEGLLDERILPGAHGIDEHARMGEVGRRDDHGVQPRHRQKLLVA